MQTDMAKHEVTTSQIMGSVVELEESVTEVRGSISKVEGSLSKVEGSLSKVEGSLSKVEGSLSEMTEFLQEHMLTKEEAFSTFVNKIELKEILTDYPTKQDLKDELSNYPTKQDLKDEFLKFESRIIGHIDSLIVMFRRHDDDLLAHRNRMDRIAGGLNETRGYCGLPPMVG